MIRRRQVDTRTRAALCKAFNIGWGDYPSLTLGQREDLLAVLREQQRQEGA
jgi:hypothetical protein